ncbi:MAG: molybdate ABC transporter substrate-binding protein [Mobilicoccus sp.]|nr:molybdate ABC transporter substrate-binding protein [Mobilicoccus sp.]
MITRRATLHALALMTLALAACTSAPEAGDDRGDITVYAAASLREVFDDIGAEVEEETGATIRFTYAGSSDLAAQLAEGAPGDVFASADETQMAAAVRAGVVGEPQPFATNTLTVVVPPGNPAGVSTWEDMALTRTVVCAPQVPCGAATRRVVEQSGSVIQPVSEESSVTDVLGKIVAGEGDAGFVYVTDAIRAGDTVEVVDLAGMDDVVNVYPIAVTTHGEADAARAATAQAFVDAVLGEVGRDRLAEAGFGPPPS